MQRKSITIEVNSASACPTLVEVEIAYILLVMSKHSSKLEAAKALGIAPKSIYNRLERAGLHTRTPTKSNQGKWDKPAL